MYSAPWWLRGRHAQTIWGKLARRRRSLSLLQRLFPTPDGDEVELHSLPAVPGAPHVVLLHGLEGSLQSHYVNGILSAAARAQLNAHVLIFRSCGRKPNRTRRFYHSGETGDVRLVVDALTSEHALSPFFLAGVSLGGNVLLKYLGEDADSVPANVTAAAAVSVPFDLFASASAVNHGFARMYQSFFLKTLREKIAEKARRFEDLPSRDRIMRVRTLVEFDDLVTARLHGFDDARDYYTRSSALRFLSGVRVPTLLLSSYDDPFLPRQTLEAVARAAEKNSALHIEFHERGGHAGFVGGRFPWKAEYYMDTRILRFFRWSLTRSSSVERLKT